MTELAPHRCKRWTGRRRSSEPDAALEAQIGELISSENRVALWSYLAATAKINDQEGGDE
jgi:hypothetical protein